MSSNRNDIIIKELTAAHEAAKARLVDLQAEFAAARREEAEAKTFWDEFFGVFGIRRRTVASVTRVQERVSARPGRPGRPRRSGQNAHSRSGAVASGLW